MNNGGVCLILKTNTFADYSALEQRKMAGTRVPICDSRFKGTLKCPVAVTHNKWNSSKTEDIYIQEYKFSCI